MKKAIMIIAFLMAIGMTGLLTKTAPKECSACGTWYTCDPPRCSQTVTYWDTWRECMDYSNAMGYPGCVCYGQVLRNR